MAGILLNGPRAGRFSGGVQSTENTAGLGGKEVKRRPIVLKAVLVGVLAGALGSIFRLTLGKGEYLRDHLIALAPGGWGLRVALVIGGAARCRGGHLRRAVQLLPARPIYEALRECSRQSMQMPAQGAAASPAA